MTAAQKNLIEEGYKLEVYAVEKAEMGEVIREILTAGKVLFERREAAAERVAPGVDDLGVRQNKMDQASGEPIIRHFIDEEPRIGLAVDPRSVEIPLAEDAKLGRHTRHHPTERRDAMAAVPSGRV